MKLCIRIQLAISVLLLASCEPEPSPEASVGNLVWSDEFEGSVVNPSFWTFETGNNGGWGNSEWEVYQASNASLQPIPGESGHALVITAQKEADGSFTSARMKTQGKLSWTHGRIEARMKLPQGQGLWPAFWMLGENLSTVGWPQCGEIDIMEMVGGSGTRDKTTYGTLHWNQGGHQYQGDSYTAPAALSSSFHVYGITWTASSIQWDVDGKVYFARSISDPAFAAFQKPAFLLLNLAVGGNWPGSPDGTTVFPQKFWVDWIHVYQIL